MRRRPCLARGRRRFRAVSENVPTTTWREWSSSCGPSSTRSSWASMSRVVAGRECPSRPPASSPGRRRRAQPTGSPGPVRRSPAAPTGPRPAAGSTLPPTPPRHTQRDPARRVKPCVSSPATVLRQNGMRLKAEGATPLGIAPDLLFAEAARRIELLYRALQVPVSGSVTVRDCPSMQVAAFPERERTAPNVGGCVVGVWSARPRPAPVAGRSSSPSARRRASSKRCPSTASGPAQGSPDSAVARHGSTAGS
jgi:hypothetical protein